MSKLKCNCGHVIIDQTDNIPYKGHILPDNKLEEVFDVMTDSIDSLHESIKSNTRLNWIKKHFDAPPYPLDLNDSSMIRDLVSSKLYDCRQEVFECENCGRVLIQLGQSNQFKSFLPETQNERKIFVGK